MGAYLCCDRASGRAKSVSFWASEEARDRNEREGGFGAAVATSDEVIVERPVRSYWSVRIVV